MIKDQRKSFTADLTLCNRMMAVTTRAKLLFSIIEVDDHKFIKTDLGINLSKQGLKPLCLIDLIAGSPGMSSIETGADALGLIEAFDDKAVMGKVYPQPTTAAGSILCSPTLWSAR